MILVSYISNRGEDPMVVTHAKATKFAIDDVGRLILSGADGEHIATYQAEAYAAFVTKTEDEVDEDLAAAFNEWARQYREEPEKFLSHEETDAQPLDGDDSYGAQCVRTIRRIEKELGQ